MRSNTTKIILVYAIFLIVAIMGINMARKGQIINSFDILMNTIGIYIGFVGVLLSVLFLHIFFINEEFKALPMWVKILLHFPSIVFISWGIAGGLISINILFSEGKKELINVKIIDSYERLPKNDYKYSYSYSRYYLDFIDLKTNKQYHTQVHENFYDDARLQKIAADNYQDINQSLSKETLEFMRENNVKIPEQKKFVTLQIPVGYLGFWE